MINAITIIKRDHRAIKTDYLQFKTLSGNEQRRIAEKIFSALDAHAKMEEEFFYPTVVKEASTDARILIESALAEHAETKQLIQRFRREQDWLGFEMKIEELLAGVMHHVHDEEKQLLPLVKDSLSQQRLEALGAEMDLHSPSRGQTVSDQIGEQLKSNAAFLTKKKK
ncbi:MAG: hemerythrin protein [Parcubacteria group bacterium]|nr:hemerythrin protein [Parcubacteria group bacterium]